MPNNELLFHKHFVFFTDSCAVKNILVVKWIFVKSKDGSIN